MIPRDLHFLFPQAAWLLIAIPFLILLSTFAIYKRKAALDTVANPSIWDKIGNMRSPRYTYYKNAFFCLAWFFACLALMQPVGNEHFMDKSYAVAPEQEVIFLIDSSASMATIDTPSGISRFDYAKEIADLVMAKVKGNDMVLATFTTGLNLISPQTHDILFLRIRLKNLELNEGGSAPGTDFLSSLSELTKTVFFDPDAPLTLILFSDGGDLAIEDLPESQQAQAIALILETVNSKEFPYLTIFSVGVGTIQGGAIPPEISGSTKIVSRLNPSLLIALSKATGGKYFDAHAANAEKIATAIIENIEKKNSELATSTTLLRSARVYDEYFQFPLGVSIFFLLLFLFFPEGKKTALLSILLFFCESGFCTEDFIARQYYEAGDYEEAKRQYEDLLATASEKYYPLIGYNLGTIALAEGKPLEAIDFLEAIPFASEISANIKRKALINKAIAYLQFQKKKNNPYEKIYYLKKSLQALYLADRLECSQDHCLIPSDFFAIKNALSEEFKRVSHEDFIFDLLLGWENQAFFKEGSNEARAKNDIPYQDMTLESIFAYYENVPIYFLIQDLASLYNVDANKVLMIALLEKAKLDFPSLEISQEKLINSLNAENNDNETLASYFYLESLDNFLAIKNSKMTHLVKKAILGVIEKAKIVVQMEMFLLSNEAKLSEKKGAISLHGSNVYEMSILLPKTIYEWQKIRFEEGICQCTPWNEVMPLLFNGNHAWEKALKVEPSYLAITLQKKAIRSWLKALEIMETVPEGSLENRENENETLQEIQKMQILDKELSEPKKIFQQGGKFW